MNNSLQKAFVEASQLSDAVQEQLAQQVLDDISGELKWDQTLAESQDLLESLANTARLARAKRKTTNKGFDQL